MSGAMSRAVNGNAQNNGTDLAILDDHSNNNRNLVIDPNSNDNSNDNANNGVLTREEKWNIVKRGAITANLGKAQGRNEKLVDVYHNPVGRSGTGRSPTDIWKHYDRQMYKYEQLDSIAEDPEYRFVARGYCKHCGFNAGSDSARLTHIKQCSAVTAEIRSKLAIKSQSAPSSNGHNERSFNPIQRNHTKARNRLRPDTLRKIVYIENNLKLLKHFE